MTDSTSHRCGFITLVGRPNVGKSTLLNQLLGEKIAITSPKPQTTRNRIPGVLTRPGVQIGFIDTPGIHRARGALNRYMVDVAESAIWETDVVALLVEAGAGPEGQVAISDTNRRILRQLGEVKVPVVLLINKIDRVPPPVLLPLLQLYSEAFELAELIPISALTGDGVDRFVDVARRLLPEGPPLFPADVLTELPERFIAAELVREKLFRRLGAELPYSAAVTIEGWRERARDGLVEIDAVIHVERASQKGIVIGKGGRMIKDIGMTARVDLERLLGVQVHLSLLVKVERGWTRSMQGLRRVGFDVPDADRSGES